MPYLNIKPFHKIIELVPPTGLEKIKLFLVIFILVKNSYQCSNCNNTFLRENGQVNRYRKKGTTVIFCSHNCRGLYNKKLYSKSITCSQCNKTIIRQLGQIRKSKSQKCFCSQSCAAIYNNTHKNKGTKISKLEIYIQSKLINLYPNLEFHFNKTDIINSELDIYIPSLKLAFELNGIFHYQPIYGSEKLQRIQNNDKRKFQTCLEQNIKLYIIDTSSLKYFKEENNKKYLDIIISIIKLNIN